jgi:hypothetical protein
MMPEELHNWEHSYGWHERENLWYDVVREPKLYRGGLDAKYTKRTTWFKNSEGWRKSENKVLWHSLPSPRGPVAEWCERAVFIFELGDAQSQLESLHYVAACLESGVIDIPVCNVRGWHNILVDKGHVRNDGNTDLTYIASCCCDMVNLKWSADDEWGEGIIDTIEAVTLGSGGVYPSLIGTLVIVIHDDHADLRIVNQAHVLLRSFSNMPIIICHCLYEELKGEDSVPSLVACAPLRCCDRDGERRKWSVEPLSKEGASTVEIDDGTVPWLEVGYTKGQPSRGNRLDIGERGSSVDHDADDVRSSRRRRRDL